MRRSLILAAGICSHAAALELDKLSNCADLGAAVDALAGPYAALGGACRAPRTSLERLLLRRLGQPDSANACFVTRPPLKGLAGFGCIRMKFSPFSAALTCFADASAAAIDGYKATYDTAWSARVTAYLNDAQSCGVALKDAAQTDDGLGLQTVTVLGRHEFGYVLKLKAPPGAIAWSQHGYVRVDRPDRPSALPDAFEYVHYAINKDASAKALERKPQLAGVWRIEAGTMNGARMMGLAGRSDVPLLASVVDWRIERPGSPARSQQDKLQLLQRWKAALQRSLENEGFDLHGDEAVKASRLMAGSLPRRLQEALPPALRENLRALMGDAQVQVKRGSPPCAARDDSRLVAMAFLHAPVPDVADDYGGLGVMLFGVGQCHRDDDSARRYVAALTRQLENDFRQRMEQEQ